jgi:hypothetical protein
MRLVALVLPAEAGRLFAPEKHRMGFAIGFPMRVCLE